MLRFLAGPMVQPGEGLLFALLFTYQFLIIFSYNIIKPVRSSLLVDGLGADALPIVYLIIALVVGFAVTGYQWFVARLQRETLVTGVILFFSLNLLFFWVILRDSHPYWKAIFFIWGDIFSVTIVSMGWSYANDLLSPDQGKRLFGPISTGATIGGILGAQVTSTWAVTVGSENLLLASAFLLAPCIVVPIAVKHFGLGLQAAPKQDVKQKEEKSPLEGLKLIARTPYLIGIVALVGLMVLASLLIEYQINKAIELGVPGKDAKTAYQGNMLFWVNIINFVTQFFLLGPMVKSWGIGVVLLIHPIVTAITSGVYWLFPVLNVMWWVKMLDWTVKYGLSKTTNEMLYLPTDRETKFKAKAFIDIFFYRLMKAVVAAVVLTCSWIGVELRTYSILVILITVAWIVIASTVARGYRKYVGERVRAMVRERFSGKTLETPREWSLASIRATLVALHGDLAAAVEKDPPPDGKATGLQKLPGAFRPLFDQLAKHHEDPDLPACLEVLEKGDPKEAVLILEYLEIFGDKELARPLTRLLARPMTASEAREAAGALQAKENP